MNRTTSARSRVVFSGAVLSLALATAATAMAVDVRGRLRVPSDFGHTAPEAPDEAQRNRYWDQWNGFIEPRRRDFDAARDLAIVLTGEGELAADQPGFRLANGGLWPTTLVTRTGARLEIQNFDTVSHQLSAEGIEGFSDTPTAPGRMRPIDMPTAGHFTIADTLYEHVTGHLHVIDDLVARATVTSTGQYHFQNITPGTYTLKVFYGEQIVHTQEGLVVEERELTLEPVALGAGAAQ